MKRTILTRSCFIVVLLWVLIPSFSRAQIKVPPGFTFKEVSLAGFTSSGGARGLAAGPGGAFGTEMFVAVGDKENVKIDPITNKCVRDAFNNCVFENKVLKVNPTTGVVTIFTVWSASVESEVPTGLAFGPNTFGNGNLFVSRFTDPFCSLGAPGGTIVTVSSAGAVSPSPFNFIVNSTNTLCEIHDLAFPPAGSPFGSNLFVSNGRNFVTAFVDSFSYISKVAPTGANSVFLPSSAVPKHSIPGIAFPPAGSAFGNNMFVTVANMNSKAQPPDKFADGEIHQVTTSGTLNPTAFASGLGLAAHLAFSKGGVFGENIYVSDPNTQTIFKVDKNGNVTPFATGFSFTPFGFDADLAFSADGSTLFVANGLKGIVAISCGPLADLVSRWPGDGNANDIQGANPGTLSGGVTFASGKDLQAFNFNGVDAFVTVGTSDSLAPANITVDFWMNGRLHGPPGLFSSFSWPLLVRGGYWAFSYNTTFVMGIVQFCVGGSCVSTAQFPVNEWHHIAGTYNGSTLKVYFDGQLADQTPLSFVNPAFPSMTSMGCNFSLDTNSCSEPTGFLFDGLVDEVEIYKRALSDTEIQAIFEQAGNLGKCKNVSLFTPLGFVTVNSDLANITFLGNVTSAGITTVTPIDPNSAGKLPGGFQIPGGNVAFNITTTATFTPPILVCFTLPSVNDPVAFDALSILHSENGVLVDRTRTRDFASRTICALVDSLSPFVIAQLANRSPVAKCKNISVSAGSSCTASISPSDVNNGSFDPDPGDTISLSLNSTGPFGLGSKTVTLTVTDNHGASNSCAATVTVQDTTPPTITAPPPVNRTTGIGATMCGAVVSDVLLGTATASDNCPGVTITRTGIPAGNFFPVGSATITYTALDASGNTKTASQTVTVLDNTPPTITPPPDIVRSNDPGRCSAVASVGTPITSDNCAVASVANDAPANGVFPVGTTTVHWKVTDVNGNNSTASQTVTVKDTEPPKITCPADIKVEFTSEAGAAVSFPTPAATDNCAVASVACLLPSGLPASGNTFPIATTNVNCTATDTSANKASCEFTVTVLGPRGVKQNVLNELVALRKTVTNKEDGDKLDEAIKHLTKSLDPTLWIDQTHLQAKKGEEAFQEEKDAVDKLRDLIKEKKSAIPDAVLQDFINRIVKSDRLLALVAINDAIAAHGDQKEIDKAKDELGKGDSDVAATKYESGIEHYRNTWQHALKATGKE